MCNCDAEVAAELPCFIVEGLKRHAKISEEEAAAEEASDTEGGGVHSCIVCLNDFMDGDEVNVRLTCHS